MGKHAQIAAGEVPFAEVITSIEELRRELAALKPQAKSDPAARAEYAAKSDDLRTQYATLAAEAATKVAGWVPYEEKLGG